YYEHHRGSGRPIVLVHGWGANARAWDTTLPALLANGNEVVTLDQRCCGRSDKDFEEVSIAALGEDVVRLVDHLSLDRPVINGWSLGGAVATAAVAKLGDRASGLVLTGGASPRYTATDDWPHGGTTADVEGILDALAANRAATLRGVAEAVCAENPGEAVLDWLWDMFMEMGPRGDQSLRDLAEVDLRKELAGLEVPILLLHGRADTFVPYSQAEAVTELNSRAELVEFAGGHAPFLEDRDRYLGALTGFLNRWPRTGWSPAGRAVSGVRSSSRRRPGATGSRSSPASPPPSSGPTRIELWKSTPTSPTRLRWHAVCAPF